MAMLDFWGCYPTLGEQTKRLSATFCPHGFVSRIRTESPNRSLLELLFDAKKAMEVQNYASWFDCQIQRQIQRTKT